MAASPSGRRNNNNHSRNAASYAEDASRLIRENMKCPVCLEVLLPPIYQCETGHNICHLCVDEVTECPLCKSDYGDTRNYFAEELVNSMTFPCKYEEYGCHKTFLGSQLKDHQANCQCQPYRCPELACQEVAGIHQMAKHLDKHGFKVMTGDAHQASVEILDDHFDRKTEYNPWRISAFNQEFYTVSTRNREGMWHFWAYGLGLQKDLKKFSYEIVLYSEEKQIMYRGVVQSLRNSPEDIMRNGKCLITNDHVIKSLRKGGRIKCQVYFIQGKNWDTARRVPTTDPKGSLNKLNRKKQKKNGPQQQNEKTQGQKWNNNSPCTSTFTCSHSSKQSSSITSQVCLSPQKSRSQGLSRRGSKTRPIDIVKKELDKMGKAGLKSLTLGNRSVTDDENSFVQRVRETLRCPSCNEVITPPVYQCLIGHNVCHKCRMVRQDCSLCLSPLTDCRNFFAEELLYKTFQRCVYSKHGCRVCLPSAQMKSHEAVCEYAPFECPFNVCRSLLRSDDLLDHMKTHQITTVYNELKTEVFVPRNAPGSAISIIPNILIVDKAAFYPIILRESDGSWLFYVMTHNYPKYRFELLLKKQAKTLGFQGPVLSLRSDVSQVKVKGSGLVLTERAVKSLKVNDKLTFQIRIRKLDSVAEGAVGKDGALKFPSSWILTSKSGEIVSRTELFANKKTSVSPNDESEEEDDLPSIIGRDDTGDDNLSDSDNNGSDGDDIDSEDQTESGSSTVNPDAECGESECETCSTRSQNSKGSVVEISPEKGTSREHLHSPPPLRLSELAVNNDKRVVVESSSDPVEQQSLKQDTASSTDIITEQSNTPSFENCLLFDRNNNKASGSSGSRRRAVSTESVAFLGTSLSINSDTHDSEHKESRTLNPPSILKSPSSKCQFIKTTGNSMSMHSLKDAKSAFKIDSHSSSLISNPLLDSACEETVIKNSSKRSRSSSKHRVRLSDQVICCGISDPPEDVNGNDLTCRSQSNVSGHSSKTLIRTVPSKHVLSVEIRENTDKESTEDEETPTTNEFQELKEAVSNHEYDDSLLEEVDLLTAKSLSEMTDAVINGSIDVVKSVISLFTSETPPPQEKPRSKAVKESIKEKDSTKRRPRSSKSK